MKWPKSEENLEKLGGPPDGVPPIAKVWLCHCSNQTIFHRHHHSPDRNVETQSNLLHLHSHKRHKSWGQNMKAIKVSQTRRNAQPRAGETHPQTKRKIKAKLRKITHRHSFRENLRTRLVVSSAGNAVLASCQLRHATSPSSDS